MNMSPLNPPTTCMNCHAPLPTVEHTTRCDECLIVYRQGLRDGARITAVNANRILDAWEHEGSNPEYHRAMQAKLRREWPALARIIEISVFERKAIR